MNADGTFSQAEVTSCGLNGGPLKAEGEYGAYIACNLFSKKGVRFYTFKAPAGCHPYFTQSGEDREDNPDQYIANFCNGATAGFKYFDFAGNKKIAVTVCGNASGTLVVKDGLDGNVVAKIAIKPCTTRKEYSAEMNMTDGVRPLYFTFEGSGKFNFYAIKF